MGLLALAVSLAFLRRWHYALAAWVLVGSTLAPALLAATWLGISAAAWLVVAPVARAMLFVSRTAGLIPGAVTRVAVLLAPAANLDASLSTRVITLLGLWSARGIVHGAPRPMFTTVRWAWSGYRHSHALLKQARDYQARLHGALDELTSTDVRVVSSAPIHRPLPSGRGCAHEASPPVVVTLGASCYDREVNWIGDV